MDYLHPRDAHLKGGGTKARTRGHKGCCLTGQTNVKYFTFMFCLKEAKVHPCNVSAHSCIDKIIGCSKVMLVLGSTACLVVVLELFVLTFFRLHKQLVNP